MHLVHYRIKPPVARNLRVRGQSGVQEKEKEQQVDKRGRRVERKDGQGSSHGGTSKDDNPKKEASRMQSWRAVKTKGNTKGRDGKTNEMETDETNDDPVQ